MRFARSLKGRLAIITAVAIVVTGTVVLLFGFFIARSTLREQEFKLLESVVSRTKREVQTTLEDLGSLAGVVSSNPQLRRDLAGAGAGSAVAADLGGTLAAATVNGPSLQMSVVAPDGRVVASTPADKPLEPASTRTLPAWMLSRVAEGRDAFAFGVKDGGVIITVASPLYGADSTQLPGVLVIDQHAVDLEKELLDTSGLGPSGRILLSHSQAAIVNALLPPADRAARKEFTMVKLGPKADLAPVRAARGEKGEGQIREKGGASFVAAWDYMPVSSWGVSATEKSSEAFAPIYRLRNVNILVILVLLIGGCALAYLIARSIARPLEELQAGVKALAGGELETRVTISDGTEVTELADEFNNMAGRLNDLYQNLERKVEERTRELQEVNEQLKILDELKSDFVSMASHELRSPLSSMKMGVATVVKEMVGPLNDEQKMMLTIAERNIDRLTKLTTDLLDLTKIEAGQLDLDLGENDLVEVAREVVEADAPEAAEKGLRLEVVSSSGEVVARCDRDRIYQVIQNLVGNALRFTEEGSVTITVALEGESAVLHVADTGVGIAPGSVNTIFEKWSQAHEDTRSEMRGAGLGLAICKGIVEAHGGGITVDSELGKGTEFTFRISLRGPDEREEQDPDSR
jgi:signal transduction histidine kinase